MVACRILEWINVGQPDERVLGKAASQADQVLLFPFAAGVATWWRTVGPKVAGLPNLSVVQIPHAPVQRLAQTVDRRVSAAPVGGDGGAADGGVAEDLIYRCATT